MKEQLATIRSESLWALRFGPFCYLESSLV